MEKNLNIEYENSKFKKEITKEFPLIVIYVNRKDNSKADLYCINNFSFSTLEKEAILVFNKTIEAFNEGEENLFTKESDKMKFHIRPKASTSADTYEFTNGNFITKRTFWANKDTIKDLINKYKNSKQDNT